jgi:hypothetical protein
MTGQANLRPLDDTEMSGDYAMPHAHGVDRNATASRTYRTTREAGIEFSAAPHRRRTRVTLDAILQIAIALLTVVAIGLVTSGTEYARWGHVAGLASQPFYIAATWRARQWGMLAVAIALCGLWARGIANTF